MTSLEVPASPPLTVAHLTGESGFSGGEVQLFLLMEGLRKLNHHNVLLCPPGSLSEREAKRRSLEVRAVGIRHEWSPRSVFGVTRALRELGPSVVHLHTGHATWLGGLAAGRLGIPAVATRRMDRTVKRNLRTRLLYRRCIQRAVAISPAVARQLLAGGVPESILRVIPSAVDPGALVPQHSREEVRESLGATPGRPALFTAATLVKRKGIDVLLRAVGELAERDHAPELWIAGEGPERGRLERLAARLDIQHLVRFLGRRRDVPDLLNACDVFTLPSRHEGLGVAALEAMALARPVVASRVGGLAEAVHHEVTGLLVPPDSVSELAAALARLLDDPTLAKGLAAAGPTRIAEEFGLERMVGGYARLYRDVLDERRGS